MFCKSCGNQLGDHAKFCAKCGIPTNQSQSSDNDIVYKTKAEKNIQQPKIKFNTSVIVFCVISVVIFAGILTVIYRRNSVNSVDTNRIQRIIVSTELPTSVLTERKQRTIEESETIETRIVPTESIATVPKNEVIPAPTTSRVQMTTPAQSNVYLDVFKQGGTTVGVIPQEELADIRNKVNDFIVSNYAYIGMPEVETFEPVGRNGDIVYIKNTRSVFGEAFEGKIFAIDFANNTTNLVHSLPLYYDTGELSSASLFEDKLLDIIVDFKSAMLPAAGNSGNCYTLYSPNLFLQVYSGNGYTVTQTDMDVFVSSLLKEYSVFNSNFKIIVVYTDETIKYTVADDSPNEAGAFKYSIGRSSSVQGAELWDVSFNGTAERITTPKTSWSIVKDMI